ncbi:MAG: hypothetical protein ACI8WB_000233 [Phenylobacterium sp.]|jgi:hypothetical protein
MMNIIFCLLSFALGWRLSTWSRKEPVYGATQFTPDSVMTDTTTAGTDELAPLPQQQDLAIAEASVAEEPWAMDLSYLNDDSSNELACDNTETVDQTLEQTQRYFLDIFHNDHTALAQRLEALKAATAINHTLFDDSIINQLHHILQTVDCSTHHDDIICMLNMLEGKADTNKLTDLASYLAAEESRVREEALKTITRADTDHLYQQQVESILLNDPKSEVRALACVLLDQYYSPKTFMNNYCAA